MSEPTTGRLVLGATPIGHRGDASPRLLDLLAEADIVAAEDTRRLRRLLQALDLHPRGQIVSHHEHNEQASAAGLVERIRGGDTVLLVSDAGMPTVSDPGYRLVRAALDAGLTVTTIPGPSAVLAALAVSGLATDRFSFEGFVPRRPGERTRALTALSGESRTMVFFEAPQRVPDTLAAMAQAFGAQRPGAVCRELTKTHEEVVRGPLEDLVEWADRGRVLGEVTIVVSGADGSATEADLPGLVEQVNLLVSGGSGLKAAVRQVAEGRGIGTGRLYEAVLQSRRS